MDLGTLKSDNSGHSAVEALSADGKVAVGGADNDKGFSCAAVWRLSYPNQTPPTPNPLTLNLLTSNPAPAPMERGLVGGMQTSVELKLQGQF